MICEILSFLRALTLRFAFGSGVFAVRQKDCYIILGEFDNEGKLWFEIGLIATDSEIIEQVQTLQSAIALHAT